MQLDSYCVDSATQSRIAEYQQQIDNRQLQSSINVQNQCLINMLNSSAQCSTYTSFSTTFAPPPPISYPPFCSREATEEEMRPKPKNKKKAQKTFEDLKYTMGQSSTTLEIECKKSKDIEEATEQLHGILTSILPKIVPNGIDNWDIEISYSPKKGKKKK